MGSKFFRTIFSGSHIVILLCFFTGAVIVYAAEDDFDLTSEDFDLLDDKSLGLDLYSDTDLLLNNDFSNPSSKSESNYDTGDIETVNVSKKIASFSGSIIQNITYGTDTPGVAFNRTSIGFERIRTTLSLDNSFELNDKIRLKTGGLIYFDLGEKDKGNYRISNGKLKGSVRDLYADITLPKNIWLRVGNQIIARGQFDSSAITDLINPRDNSIPGQGELTDFRRHVPAVFISTPLSEFHSEIVITQNAGANILDVVGGAFDPGVSLGQLPVFYITSNNPTEVFGRLNYSFNGGDISFFVAEFNDNSPVLKEIEILFGADNTNDELLVTGQRLGFGYDRQQSLGVSGSIARGDQLFKYEFSSLGGASIPSDEFMLLPWNRRNQILGAVGIDYSGINELVLGAEITGRFIQNFTEDLAGSETSIGQAFVARWTTLNDTLSIMGNYSRLPGDSSSIASVAVAYDFLDSLELSGRIVQYNASKESDSFYPYRKQDVISFSSKYSF